MKKIISLILALTMVFALAVSASAATITIDSAVDDNPDNGIYKAYKVFDATVSGTGADQKVAYTIDNENQFYDTIKDYTYNGTKVFTLTATGSIHSKIIYNVEVADSFTGEDAAKDLAAKLEKVATTADATSTGNQIEVGTGYYLITTYMGTALIVDTYSGDKTITTKNEFPSLEKKIVKINDTAFNPGVDSTSANIGDTITYQLTITIPETFKEDTQNIHVHDVLGSGFDIEGKFSSNIEGKLEFYDTMWDGTGDHSELAEIYMYDSNDLKGKTVTITYDVILNEDAIIGSEGNKNQAWLTYGDGNDVYTSPIDEVTVYTYGFDLKKTNTTGTTITGAEFILSKNSDPDVLNDANYDQNWILFTNSGNTYTAGAAGGTPNEYLSKAIIYAGEVEIRGLAKGTYYLHEKKAPDGYNKLAAPIKIEITENGIKRDDGEASADLTVTVENETGTVLPSTGGMGTTLFYILGGLMAVSALVILVTNKRMRA